MHACENTAVHSESAGHAISAVSWGAIIAGAVAAAALSLILLLLGTGLGLSSVSPWADSGAGAKALGVGAIVWLTITQLLASGMGGYLAGRLRSAWTGVAGDEVFFRDSAHGFLAWALATLITAGLLSSAVSTVVGGGLKAGGAVASGAVVAVAGGATAAANADGDGSSDYAGYYIDSLFRKATADSDINLTSTEPPSPEALAEVTRIFANALAQGALPQQDANYLGRQIAVRTNLSSQEATQRVQDTFAELKARLEKLEQDAREAADTARKASAGTALWLFISLLIGAFIAAFTATRAGSGRACCHTTHTQR